MNKKHSVKIIKKFAKISALTLSLVFSLNSFGEKNMIPCNFFSLGTYSDAKLYIQRRPDDAHLMSIMALSAFCMGKEKEGLELLKRTSAMGHVHATYLMGAYYASGETFNSKYWLTPDRKDDSENFASAIYYYEQAADQIMSAFYYPYGVNPDQPDWERHYTTTAKVFVGLPNFYYEVYMRAVENTLADSKRGKKMSDADTIVGLVKMRNWSERCLKRPVLDVWKVHIGIGITNAMKANCQVMNNFAVQVLPLEQQRIKIVEDQCKDVLLHECTEHQNIFNQIMDVSDILQKMLKFVPRV